MTPTTWTTEKPIVPGWYWFRNDRTHELEIIVSSINGIDNRLYAIGLNARGLFSQGLHDNYHGEWAGPIYPPQETR